MTEKIQNAGTEVVEAKAGKGSATLSMVNLGPKALFCPAMRLPLPCMSAPLYPSRVPLLEVIAALVWVRRCLLQATAQICLLEVINQRCRVLGSGTAVFWGVCVCDTQCLLRASHMLAAACLRYVITVHVAACQGTTAGSIWGKLIQIAESCCVIHVDLQILSCIDCQSCCCNTPRSRGHASD